MENGSKTNSCHWSVLLLLDGSRHVSMKTNLHVTSMNSMDSSIFCIANSWRRLHSIEEGIAIRFLSYWSDEREIDN